MQKLYELVGLFRKGTHYRSKLDGYLSAFINKNQAELRSEVEVLRSEISGLELEVGTEKFKKLNPVSNSSQPNYLMLLMIAEAKLTAINMLLAINFQYLNNAVSADHIRSQLEKKLFEYNERKDLTPDFKSELAYLQNTFLEELHRLVNPATGFTLVDTDETLDDFLQSNATKVKNPALPLAKAANPNGVVNDTKKQLEQRGAMLSNLLKSTEELEMKAQQSSKASKAAQFGRVK